MDHDLEKLARNELAHFLHQITAALIGFVAMDDHRHRIDHVAVDAHVELHKIGRAVAGDLVIHRRIAAAHRFKPIIEIYDNFVQRQLVDEHGPLRTQVADFFLRAAFLFADFKHATEKFLRQMERRLDDRLLDPVDLRFVGQLHRIIDHEGGAGNGDHAVNHGCRRGDQAQAELALETFAHDVHMQQAQKAAAKAKAQRL